MVVIAEQEWNIKYLISRVHAAKNARARLCEVKLTSVDLLDEVRLLPEQALGIDPDHDLALGPLNHQIGEVLHGLVNWVGGWQSVGEPQAYGRTGFAPTQQCCRSNAS